MCKHYTTLYACLCKHDLKVIKPCTCFAERSSQELSDKLCDIFQAAKEPIILRDRCPACTQPEQHQQPSFGGQQSTTKRVVGRYYESTEVQEMPRTTMYDRLHGYQDVAVLEPEAFDSMFKLREMLPGLDEVKLEDGDGEEVDPEDEQQSAVEDGQDMPVATFSMELVDRTRAT